MGTQITMSSSESLINTRESLDDLSTSTLPRSAGIALHNGPSVRDVPNQKAHHGPFERILWRWDQLILLFAQLKGNSRLIVIAQLSLSHE